MFDTQQMRKWHFEPLLGQLDRDVRVVRWIGKSNIVRAFREQRHEMFGSFAMQDRSCVSTQQLDVCLQQWEHGSRLLDKIAGRRSARQRFQTKCTAAAAKEAAEALDVEQVGARKALETERAGFGKRIADAQAKRAASAAKVSAGLLARYDRMNTRRKGQAVFALRNFSCGQCDTSVSMQRRPALSSGQIIETCEGCGVLLYFEAAPTAPAAH